MLQITRPIWFYAALAWVLAANAADLGLTLYGLRLGAIHEANPLLAPLLAARPGLAAGLKLAAGVVAVLIFHVAYPLRQRLVTAALLLVSLLLLGVLLVHAWWLGLV